MCQTGRIESMEHLVTGALFSSEFWEWKNGMEREIIEKKEVYYGKRKQNCF